MYSIINNSAAHFSIMLKFGRLMQYETWKLGRFNNLLLVIYKVAESATRCKRSVRVRPHSHISSKWNPIC